MNPAYATPSRQHRPKRNRCSILVAFVCTSLFFSTPALASEISEPSKEVESSEDDTADAVEGIDDDIPETAPQVDDDTPEEVKRIVAHDREKEPSRAELDDDEAEQLTETLQTAIAAEEQKEYDKARQKFVHAYDIHPHSNLLLSVARTSDNLGEQPAALEGYQTFLKRQPDYDNRSQIEERIEFLEEARKKAAKKKDLQKTEEMTTTGLSLPSAVGWTGVAGVVVGTGSLIAAGAISSSVDREFTQLEASVEAGERSESLQTARDIGRKQARGRFFMYGGLTMVFAGATLVVVDYAVLDRPPLFGEESSEASLRRTPELVAGQEAVLLKWGRTF